MRRARVRSGGQEGGNGQTAHLAVPPHTVSARRYEGWFVRKRRHGHGTLFRRWSEEHGLSRVYVGEWTRGKMSGMGLRYYPDGSRYVGTLCDGRRHGPGRFEFAPPRAAPPKEYDYEWSEGKDGWEEEGGSEQAEAPTCDEYEGVGRTT